MNEHEGMNVNRDEPMVPDLEDEVLIGRLIDHEAGPADQDRFEQLADVRPELWRALALRQRDMMALATQVDEATAGVERVELPGSLLIPHRLTWTLALSGWAAVLIVALTWAVIVMVGDVREGIGEVSDGAGGPVMPPARVEVESPRDLLDRYIANAPWDVNELDPSFFRFDLGTDGGYLWIMRRFDERYYLGPDDAQRLTDMQADGVDLPHDPIELRKLLGLPSTAPDDGPMVRPN